MQPVLISGSHRSGTTWVGMILDKAPGTFYIHEPFNPKVVKSLEWSKWCAFDNPNSLLG